MIVGSWEGKRTTTIAQELSCHPQTVRERITRFNAEGVDGLGDAEDVCRLPGGIEVHGAEGVAEDVAEQGALNGLLGF